MTTATTTGICLNGINGVPDVPSVQFADLEPRSRRFVFRALAALLSVGFLISVLCYFVPAHPGTDQNGYLVGGKMFSKSLTMAFTPTRPGSNEFDPHQFVGRMWVGADLGSAAERYYPKYPLGLPLLYAISIWISALIKPGVSLWLAYGINPVAMAFAVFATYLLAELFAGSFFGFLALIAFATSPVTVGLATVPSSHATAVCCVAWGMYFLLNFWQQGGVLRGMFAGLLLGYAGTIRYSEGTLILPILLVGWFALSRKRLGSTIALLIGWLVPMGLLVLYNRAAIGTNTGYDPTHESSGFGLSYAVDNWETMFRQLDTNGLSLLLPLSLAGLVWMFWWNWRVASVLGSWIVPCMVIYMFYYWAPDNTSISYLRFFTTILPALALCFFWFVTRLQRVANLHQIRPTRWPIAIPITLIAIFVSLVICWLTSLHLWLGEFSPASVGLHEWQFIHRLIPADANVDVDSIRAARVAYTATFGWAIVGSCGIGLITIGMFRGRAALPGIGAGLLTGLVASMHLTNALPAIEADQLARFALQTNVAEVQRAVPDGSVIFGLRTDHEDQQLFNDLQFAGDDDLISGETFLASYVQSLPSSEPPDSPQGLDPGRRDALYNRLKQYDQNALDEQARRAVLDAIANHRRVFVVVARRDSQLQLRREHLRPPTTNRKSNQPTPGQQLRQTLIKQMPDLVQRLCAGNRLQFDVASSWFTYVPRVIPPPSGPRGLRLPRQEPLPPRRGMELLELTAPTPA